MRKKIVAGNWKMNMGDGGTKKLIKEVKKELKGLKLKNTKVIMAPAFVNLATSVKKTRKTKLTIAAQNMHQNDSGAYTGEVSADMLTSVGVRTVILGHSERRTYFGEDDVVLVEKVKQALTKEMKIIFCFGEQLEDREAGKHFEVIECQIKNVLFSLEAKEFKKIVLAYEPVWAIGTGKTATADQAQEVHAFIRKIIADNYTAELAAKVSIIYGGSVKPANAKEIFSKPDVDGGLIGGAALKAKDFAEIVKSIL